MANTIAALLHGRDNNFNLIRFLAASAVIVDHSFALVAYDQRADALVDVERLEIGRLAVDVFFIISGFLVTRSVMTQPPSSTMPWRASFACSPPFSSPVSALPLCLARS